MIGTGASAVQFLPPVAEQAARTTVFQRTGNWFLPRRNRPYPRAYRALIERVPPSSAPGGTFLFWYLEFAHADASATRARSGGSPGSGRGCSCAASSAATRSCASAIWPDYTFGCKRVLFSSYFLPALARPDVEVVTERRSSASPPRAS